MFFESLPHHIHSIRTRLERDDGDRSASWDQCQAKILEESSLFCNGIRTLWRPTRTQVSSFIAMPADDTMNLLRSINYNPTMDVNCVGLTHLWKDSFHLQPYDCTSLVVKASTSFLIGSLSDHLDLYRENTSALQAQTSSWNKLGVLLFESQ